MAEEKTWHQALCNPLGDCGICNSLSWNRTHTVSSLSRLLRSVLWALPGLQECRGSPQVWDPLLSPRLLHALHPRPPPEEPGQVSVQHSGQSRLCLREGSEREKKMMEFLHTRGGIWSHFVTGRVVPASFLNYFQDYIQTLLYLLRWNIFTIENISQIFFSGKKINSTNPIQPCSFWTLPDWADHF